MQGNQNPGSLLITGMDRKYILAILFLMAASHWGKSFSRVSHMKFHGVTDTQVRIGYFKKARDHQFIKT